MNNMYKIEPGTQISLQQTINIKGQDIEAFVAFNDRASTMERDRVGLGNYLLNGDDWFDADNAIFVVENCLYEQEQQAPMVISMPGDGSHVDPTLRDTMDTPTTDGTPEDNSKTGTVQAGTCGHRFQCVSLRARYKTTSNTMYGMPSLAVEPVQTYVRFDSTGKVYMSERMYGIMNSDPNMAKEASFCMGGSSDGRYFTSVEAPHSVLSYEQDPSVAAPRFLMKMIPRVDAEMDRLMFRNELIIPVHNPIVLRTIPTLARLPSHIADTKWVMHDTSNQEHRARAVLVNDAIVNMGASVFVARNCFSNDGLQCPADTQCVALQSLARPEYFWYFVSGTAGSPIELSAHPGRVMNPTAADLTKFAVATSFCASATTSGRHKTVVFKPLKDLSRTVGLDSGNGLVAEFLGQEGEVAYENAVEHFNIAEPPRSIFYNYLPVGATIRFEAAGQERQYLTSPLSSAADNQAFLSPILAHSGFIVDNCPPGSGYISTCGPGQQCVSLRSAANPSLLLQYDALTQKVVVAPLVLPEQSDGPAFKLYSIPLVEEASWCVRQGFSTTEPTIGLEAKSAPGYFIHHPKVSTDGTFHLRKSSAFVTIGMASGMLDASWKPILDGQYCLNGLECDGHEICVEEGSGLDYPDNMCRDENAPNVAVLVMSP